MSNLHIYAPEPIDTTTDEDPKGWGAVRMYCCRAKRDEGNYNRIIEYYEWYGSKVYFLCKGKCDERAKNDGRRGSDIYYLD